MNIAASKRFQCSLEFLRSITDSNAPCCFRLTKIREKLFPDQATCLEQKRLKDADLAVFFLRFQNFPDEQMQPIVDYLDRAGPVVGLRTSTHAFNIPKNSKYAKYDHRYAGAEYKDGFGEQVLGETWVSHYGKNHQMSTRIDIVESQKSHPILRGVKNPWTECGGYWVEPLKDSTILALTQPLQTMKKGSAPATDKKPCPNAWTREYAGKNGSKGRVFTSTSGASEDIRDEGFRRMVINGCFWAAGMEDAIKADMNVAMVGPYNPSTFQMNSNYYVGVKPLDMAGWDTPIMDNSKALKVRAPRKKPAKKPKPKSEPKKQNDVETVTDETAIYVFDETETAKPAPAPPAGAALSLDLG